MRVICIDLQQTLPCPRLNNSRAYFKRKIWCYDLCIYDCNQELANCFIWDETEAKRGSEEVGSCLMKWYEQNRAAGIRKLVIFMDNCAGQNKNIYNILTVMRMIHKGDLDEVTLEFLIPGHSYLPCDAAFGVIEQKIKKQKVIGCPEHYADVIRTATQRGNNVIKMRQSDFAATKELFSYISLRRPRGDIKFSQGRTFKLTKAKPWIYHIESLEGNTDVDLEKAKTGKSGKGGKAKGKSKSNDTEEATPLLSTVVLNPRYTNGFLKLPDGKLTDVLSLKGFIDLRGIRWLDAVVRGQRDAVDQTGEAFDEHLVADEVNWMDEDSDYDYDTVPEPI